MKCGRCEKPLVSVADDAVMPCLTCMAEERDFGADYVRSVTAGSRMERATFAVAYFLTGMAIGALAWA